MDASHQGNRRLPILVLGFFLTLFLLTSAGRMAGADPYSQLQAAMVIAVHGRIGTDHKIEPELYWVPSPSGLFYQAHDPGNVLLFLPLAMGAKAIFSTADAQWISAPPLMTRVGAAFIYAVLGAVCATVIWAALKWITDPRTAFILTGVGCLCTPFWIYTRSTMDVLGGALGVATTLLVVVRHADGRVRPTWAGILAGLACAGACWFRFSLMPFLILPTIACLYLNESRSRLRVVVSFCVSVAFALGPVFAYNAIRMGNPLTPATRAPQYALQNGIEGNLMDGLYGLFASPNHGLFVFAPVMLLTLAAPIALRKHSRPEKVIALAYACGAAAYALLIAKLTQWGKVEWGPRYLVPVFPVLIWLMAYGILYVWKRSWLLVLALAVASVLTTVPAVMVNYSVVLVQEPGAANPSHPSPAQILGAYKALGKGLTGQTLDAPNEITSDDVRSQALRFPDFWWARLLQHQETKIQLTGLIAVLVLSSGTLITGYKILQR